MTSSKYLSADERRAMTVAAVLDLAAERNPADITTTAIAARMGLSQGALFRHFPSKDAVWREVMVWVSRQLLARVDAAASTAASPTEALRAMFMAHVAFVVEHPGVPRLLFSELPRTEDSPAKDVAREMLSVYTGRLSVYIEEAKNRGEIDAGVETSTVTTVFLGAVQGLVMQGMLGGDLRHVERAGPSVFGLVERAVRAT